MVVLAPIKYLNLSYMRGMDRVAAVGSLLAVVGCGGDYPKHECAIQQRAYDEMVAVYGVDGSPDVERGLDTARFSLQRCFSVHGIRQPSDNLDAVDWEEGPASGMDTDGAGADAVSSEGQGNATTYSLETSRDSVGDPDSLVGEGE